MEPGKADTSESKPKAQQDLAAAAKADTAQTWPTDSRNESNKNDTSKMKSKSQAALEAAEAPTLQTHPAKVRIGLSKDDASETQSQDQEDLDGPNVNSAKALSTKSRIRSSKRRGRQSEETKARKRKLVYTQRRDIGKVPNEAKPENRFNEKLKTRGLEWEVEALLGSKLVKKKGQNSEKVRHYLVKWKDFSHRENTWEPETHLYNASKLIREYEHLNSGKC